MKRVFGNSTAAAIVAVVAVLVVAGAASAAAGEERSAIAFPAGSFAIDAATCVFVHPEADKPLGSTWAVGRIAFAYEDGRHDALDSCLRRRHTHDVRCWRGAVPAVTEAPADRGGYHDVTGALALRDYIAGVRACMTAGAGL